MKAKALDSLFLLYRKHSLWDSASPYTGLAAHRKVKSKLSGSQKISRVEIGLCYFAKHFVPSHPISRGILIQVETENLPLRMNDKAEPPCSTASNTHCILGNAQETRIPTTNPEFAAGFCKRPLVVFPLMNSKCCSFTNRVKKCLPSCPFNGRRNMQLLQQQTVPSCHPQMGRKQRGQTWVIYPFILSLKFPLLPKSTARKRPRQQLLNAPWITSSDRSLDLLF